MSITSTSSTSVMGSGIASRARAAVRAGLARMKARHECRKMMALGDQQFRDIGVTRADLRRELIDN
jgi:uncharacterized protein YjiS (DUF1127 family)